MFKIKLLIRMFLYLLIIIMFVIPINGFTQTLNSKLEIFKTKYNLNDIKPNYSDLMKRDEEFSLIIGFSDSNETLILESDTTITGNILLLNSGSLIIEKNINVNIDGGIYFLNTASLIVRNCKLNVKGNIMLTNSSKLDIDSTRFSFPMEYRYQYELGAFDSSEVLIKNSQISFNKGTLGGFFTDYSRLTFINDSFHQSVTISMTGHSELTIDNTQNAWEFLISDTCNINISNSLGFILWFYFHDNSVSNVSFPQGSYVNGFVFNNTIPGLDDVMYSVRIDSTAYVKWGIFPDKGSDVTINNSYLRACGIIFEDPIVDTIKGFYNKMFYSDNTFELSDRNLRLKNSEIETWNFYAMNGADLVVLYCIFGEALSFEDGIVHVLGGICDGSGGYIGTNNGTLEIIYSQIEAQVLSQGSGVSIIVESDIDMPYLNPTFTKTSIAFFGNTKYNSPLIALDSSFVLELFIDTFKNQTTNSIVPISGIVKTYKGPNNPIILNYYNVKYATKSNPLEKIVIADSLTKQIENDIVAEWNTTGLAPDKYIIYIEAFIGEDTSSIGIQQEVTLYQGTNINRLNAESFKLYNYPNPCSGETTFHYELNSSDFVNLSIYNILGHKVETLINQSQKEGNYSINWDITELDRGIYFCRFQVGKQQIIKKLIIIK